MTAPSAKAKEILVKLDIEEPPAPHLKAIADSENIRVLYRAMSDEPDLSGMLLYKGQRAGIIVNTFIDNGGRSNFTLAHELGHYFLKHKPSQFHDETGFRCTDKDMGDTPHPQEVEANHFAVELLMPDELFRPQMIGAPLDFALINGLAREFEVSKHACSFRILDFIREPCVIIFTKGFEVTGKKNSVAAKGYSMQIKAVPENSAAYRITKTASYQKDFMPCDPALWFGRKAGSINLYTCTRCHKDGYGMTILRW